VLAVYVKSAKVATDELRLRIQTHTIKNKCILHYFQLPIGISTPESRGRGDFPAIRSRWLEGRRTFNERSNFFKNVHGDNREEVLACGDYVWLHASCLTGLYLSIVSLFFIPEKT
jgi:hypothetical protein